MDIEEIGRHDRQFEMTIDEGELAVLMQVVDAAWNSSTYPAGSSAEKTLAVFGIKCRQLGVDPTDFHL